VLWCVCVLGCLFWNAVSHGRPPSLIKFDLAVGTSRYCTSRVADGTASQLNGPCDALNGNSNQRRPDGAMVSAS